MLIDQLGKEGLELLLSRCGESTGSNGPIVSCRVGDSIYQELSSIIGQRVVESDEEIIARHEWELKQTRTCTDLTENVEKVIAKTISTLEFFRSVGEIDYREAIKPSRQLKIPTNSFENIPFHFFDSHANSYWLILDYLRRTGEKVTIVRFDQHLDQEEEGDSVIRSNYLRKLMANPEVSDQIDLVITTDGESLDPAPSINGITHHTMNIRSLSQIDTPVLLDIDLDGHERITARGGIGGHWYRGKTNQDTKVGNQSFIVIHPMVVAYSLRNALPNVREIYVATERRFRTRFFHYRIEHDFLEALAA
jgi:hypothetical protein